MSTVFKIKLPKPVYPETRTLLRLTGFGGVNTHEHATRPIAAWIVRINHRPVSSKTRILYAFRVVSLSAKDPPGVSVPGSQYHSDCVSDGRSRSLGHAWPGSRVNSRGQTSNLR